MLQYIPLVQAHTSAFLYTIAQTSSLILGLSAVLLLKAVDVFPSRSDTRLSARELLYTFLSVRGSSVRFPIASDRLPIAIGGLPMCF